MEKTVQDYAKDLETIWKAVFNLPARIKFNDHPNTDDKQGMISWEGFDLYQDEITVEFGTIHGVVKQQVQGWILDMVKHIPATRDDPPDVDIIDLGEFRSFYAAVRKAIEVQTDLIVDDRLQCIGYDEMMKEEGA